MMSFNMEHQVFMDPIWIILFLSGWMAEEYLVVSEMIIGQSDQSFALQKTLAQDILS